MKKSKKQNSDNITLDPIPEIINRNTSDILYDNYNIYSSYIASGRVACSLYDGFKNVYRRVLYSAFRNCRNEKVKSVSLDGKTLASYHPHGSCYGTIVNLVAADALIGKGNWGSQCGVVDIPAAAPRYTEVRLNPLSETLFINPILLPYVDWRMSDLGQKEPAFLPTLVPYVLTAIGDTNTMDVGTGVHLKNQYPKFSVESIIDYTINYLKTGKFDKHLLEFKFMNLVKPFGNSKNYDDTSYRYEETFEATIENTNNGIFITSQLPGFNMESKLNGIPYQDFSKTSTRIFIPSKYITNDLLISKVHFSSYAYTGTDDNVVIHPYSIRIAVQQIIDNFRNIIVPRYYKSEIERLTNAINELEILITIASKIKNTKDLNKLYEVLSDDEKKIANRYSISQMMKVSKSDIEKLTNELENVKIKSKDPDKFILDLYLDAKEKVVLWKQSKN